MLVNLPYIFSLNFSWITRLYVHSLHVNEQSKGGWMGILNPIYSFPVSLQHSPHYINAHEYINDTLPH